MVAYGTSIKMKNIYYRLQLRVFLLPHFKTYESYCYLLSSSLCTLQDGLRFPLLILTYFIQFIVLVNAYYFTLTIITNQRDKVHLYSIVLLTNRINLLFLLEGIDYCSFAIMLN